MCYRYPEQQQHQQGRQQQQHQERSMCPSPPSVSSSSTCSTASSASAPSPCSNAKPQRVAQFICTVVHRTWPNRPRTPISISTSTTATCSSTPIIPTPHPSFVAFVTRVVRTSGVSSPILFLALLYIIRLRRATKVTLPTPTSTSSLSPLPLSPTSGTTSSISSSTSTAAAFESQAALAEARLVTAAIILAQKITDDNRFTNKTWSELTGFALNDVNKMEADFLDRIDFRLNVSDAEYASWVRHCSAWARQIGAPLEDTHGRSLSLQQQQQHQQHQFGIITPTPSPPLQQLPLPGYYRKRKIGTHDAAIPDGDETGELRRKIPRHPHHHHRSTSWTPGTSPHSLQQHQQYHQLAAPPLPPSSYSLETTITDNTLYTPSNPYLDHHFLPPPHPQQLYSVTYDPNSGAVYHLPATPGFTVYPYPIVVPKPYPHPYL
ncbi:hypothetical protein PhCBS80983_g02404 [Powellomyces hirtus]|uniref:Cyclin N-terminal domain-containing protein n=1 Tax=Powellomyces hirtus TaxID=109895 RepID=A0A507E8Z0_9FUNG|nr:hypothetical protein PhCBS80983_g02404 [Powellomyces hirtus]